jgi:hypothetical protein
MDLRHLMNQTAFCETKPFGFAVISGVGFNRRWTSADGSPPSDKSDGFL